ncbi:MAG: GAF domain-containing protein [Chloroflexi bacterium]|nr:GAF domain-containing protein [Chloroflexota bacterium]
MPRRNRSSWQKVLWLGDQILTQDGLPCQRELIQAEVGEMLAAGAVLWLDESLFHLPGRDEAACFPPAPPTETLSRCHQAGQAIASTDGRVAAVPLKHQELSLGALEITRPGSDPFNKSDQDLLLGIAGHIALSLVVSHRTAVEQWRIEQLTLVRRVSSQIANMLDLDELCRRVTGLIQSTFHYYYVAIFTYEAEQQVLQLRSGFGPRRGRGRRAGSPALQVQVGEGLIGHVAASGEEVVSNDIRTEPRFRFVNSLPATRSEVALPLKVENTVLGVLDLQSDLLGTFHPNDLLVLRSLADNIATAIEAARLFGNLDKRASQLSAVAEVGRNIASILELSELLFRVAAIIQERFGFPYVSMFSVHPNRRQVIYEAGSGARSGDMQGYRLSLDDPEGIIPWVARNGKTVLANDVDHEPLFKPSPLPPEDTRAELCVPFIYDERVVGLMDIQSDRPGAFRDDDRLLFEALADTVATAVHNADLYRTERWRRQVADSLREVAGLLSTDVSLDDVLDTILRQLENNLPCEVASIWLADNDEIYLAHLHGADPLEVQAAAQRWPEAHDYLTGALTSEEPVIRKPIDPLGPTGLACGFAADYSSIAAPLKVDNQPVGLLTLSHHSPGRYGHEAQAMTATFASYAAVAIENARLYDSAQEQAYASAALLQVAQTVANSNTLDETLASIARITPILVGVKSCAIYLFENGRFHPSQAYGIPDEVQSLILNGDFSPGDFPLLDAVRDRSQTIVGILTSDAGEEWLEPELARTEEDTIYALQGGDHLLLGFPVMVRNDLFGVMLVEEAGEARRFRQKRVEIVNGIAQQVALSIQNEHLQQEMVLRERLEHEVHLARQIQQTFLPEKLPVFANWELAARWRPARQVGGDFYDVFELPDGRLGLFIADVSDKGIPAALFMALTRTLVRAVVFDTPSPAAAMQRVNDLIIPDNQQSMFVTAVYVVLDLKTGDVTYANVGHNPPFWFSATSKRIESLSRSGMALGVVENIPIADKTIHLDPGDCLLMYTDGVTEAFSSAGEAYGDQRLKGFLASCAGDPVESLLATIESDVEAFAGELPPADDLTILAIKRLD